MEAWSKSWRRVHDMDQSSSPQAHPSSTTENPVVALGRKVQSVLSTHQRPSVRILREPSRNEESRLVTEASQEKTNTNDSAGIVTRATNAFRPLFSRRESPNTNEHSEQEYDPDTVDLLDVVGMCQIAFPCDQSLTFLQTRKWPLYQH